jgi:hypothetical protein
MSNDLAMDPGDSLIVLNINGFRLIFFGNSVQTFFFPWVKRRLRGTFGARAVFTKLIGGGASSSCHGGETSAAPTRSVRMRSGPIIPEVGRRFCVDRPCHLSDQGFLFRASAVCLPRTSLMCHGGPTAKASGWGGFYGRSLRAFAESTAFGSKDSCMRPEPRRLTGELRCVQLCTFLLRRHLTGTAP